MKEKAYFIFRPRTVNDLTPQSHNGTWLPYTIVKTICLPKTEFENFAADLLADRQFIEDNAYLCRNESDCLLISDLQHSKELLILYAAIGLLIGYGDFSTIPFLPGLLILLMVLILEFPIIYCLNRWLPFLVGRRYKDRAKFVRLPA